MYNKTSWCNVCNFNREPHEHGRVVTGIEREEDFNKISNPVVNNNKDKFWIIWNPDSYSAPKRKHFSYASVEKEAFRLNSENPGKTFHIVEMSYTVKSGDIPDHNKEAFCKCGQIKLYNQDVCSKCFGFSKDDSSFEAADVCGGGCKRYLGHRGDCINNQLPF